MGAALPPEQITRPAQAKVDAVAALTATAYARAATLDLTPEESEKLQADFPDEAFKPGAAGKESLDLSGARFLRDRFTQVFGMGRWAMFPGAAGREPVRTQKTVEGSRVYVEAKTRWSGDVLRGRGHVGRRWNTTRATMRRITADASKAPSCRQFRRCAKEFGIGLQAWKKDSAE